MATTTQVKPARRTSAFSAGMAFAAAATVFAGFAPSYFLKPVLHTTRFPTGRPIPGSLPLLLHLHALVFSSWLLLLILQTTLSATGRLRMHRQFGFAGGLLAASMVVLGGAVAIRGARDGWNPGGPYRNSIEFMIVGMTDILVFGVLIGAGIWFRHRPGIHKRLMILGTVGGLMWPAITRMPVVAGKLPIMFCLLALLVFAWAVRDYVVDRRVHPVSLWGGIFIAATFPARAAMAHTAVWHRVAEWIIR